MNLQDASNELLELIREADDHASFILARRGAELAREIEHRIRPIETLVDDLDRGFAPSERAIRSARDAVGEIYEICADLPQTEVALDRATFDRLRALSVDLKLAAR